MGDSKCGVRKRNPQVCGDGCTGEESSGSQGWRSWLPAHPPRGTAFSRLTGLVLLEPKGTAGWWGEMPVCLWPRVCLLQACFSFCRAPTASSKWTWGPSRSTSLLRRWGCPAVVTELDMRQAHDEGPGVERPQGQRAQHSGEPCCPQRLLAVWPPASSLTSLYAPFPHLWNGGYNSRTYSIEFLWGLNETLYVKCLEQRLINSKCYEGAYYYYKTDHNV